MPEACSAFADANEEGSYRASDVALRGGTRLAVSHRIYADVDDRRYAAVRGTVQKREPQYFYQTDLP